MLHEPCNSSFITGAPAASPCSFPGTGGVIMGNHFCDIARPWNRIPVRPWLHALLALVLLWGFNTTGAAATLYTVEVVVFENLHQESLDAEVWAADPGTPDPGNAIPLTAGLQGETASGTAPHGFRRLNPAQYTLTPLARKLERSSRYRPLLHVAWRQPGYGKSNARAVYLGGPAPNSYAGTSPDPVLQGTLKLYRSRYLHLRADLVYSPPGQAYGANPPVRVEPRPGNPAATDAGAAEQATPVFPGTVHYRMQQQRRMRSHELHYLDHPAFGMFVKITPVEIPDTPAVEEATESGARAAEPEPATQRRQQEKPGSANSTPAAR
jgi:hypothetical protein